MTLQTSCTSCASFMLASNVRSKKEVDVCIAGRREGKK
jgi:hypothetical protein